MIVVPAVLLLGAALLGLVPDLLAAVERNAARFTDHAAYARWVLADSHVAWPAVSTSHIVALDVVYALLAVAGAVGAAALGLFGRPIRDAGPRSLTGPARELARGLRALHSGHIGDYVAWWSVGASLLGGICLIALR